MAKSFKILLFLALALALDVVLIVLIIPQIRSHREGPPPTTLASPPLSAERPDRVHELEDRLAQETHARQTAEAEAAELRAEAAPLRSKVIVSLGTVAKMGRRAGAILPALREMRALLASDPASLTSAEKHRLLELQGQHADVLGMLPEIAGFQDNPAEYGSFFANLVQEAAHLTPAQATSLERYMSARAAGLD